MNKSSDSSYVITRNKWSELNETPLRLLCFVAGVLTNLRVTCLEYLCVVTRKWHIDDPGECQVIECHGTF